MTSQFYTNYFNQNQNKFKLHYLFLVFLPAEAPKKLDIDFIPFLSTFDNDFCAAVNFVLPCNKHGRKQIYN